MRLLLFNYEFPPVGGGGGRVTEALAAQYAKRGHEVLVLTSKFDGLPRLERRPGITVERVPAFRADPNVARVHEMLSYALSSSLIGLRRARTFRPDVAQVFFGIPSGLGAYLLKKTSGIPYVVFLGGRDVPTRDPDPDFYRYLYAALGPVIRSIWRNAWAITVCGEGLMDRARAFLPDRRFELIPDGVDLKRFKRRGSRENDVVRLLGIGRLIPRKGFDTLIRAVAVLKGRGIGRFELEIVGDGPERRALVSLTQTLGIEESVHFAGTVAYDRLPGHYSSADVFVLASRAEGMPLVALEAMASGLPIVTADIPAMVALVEPGENGSRFSPVDDPESLADCLAPLILDRELRLRLAANSRRRAQAYGWEEIAESYLDVLAAARSSVGTRPRHTLPDT